MPCATAKTKSPRLTPFEVLGVSAADDYATIRKAWKRLVKANHPDQCPADAARLTKRLQQINDAFEKLRNHVPVKGAAKATQTRDFAAEAAREKARKQAQAQAQAAQAQVARAKAQAKAAAEARAARQAEQAAQARKRAQAPRFSDAQRAALRTATRAFTDARTAFANSARHGYASAA